MPMINFSNPLILLITTLIFVLMLILAKETKKSVITGIMLFVFVGLLIFHTVWFLTTPDRTEDIVSGLIFTIVFDLIFVFVSFISYLWIDDIEAKEKKKESIDNSLDWFWSKIG